VKIMYSDIEMLSNNTSKLSSGVEEVKHSLLAVMMDSSMKCVQIIMAISEVSSLDFLFNTAASEIERLLSEIESISHDISAIVSSFKELDDKLSRGEQINPLDVINSDELNDFISYLLSPVLKLIVSARKINGCLADEVIKIILALIFERSEDIPDILSKVGLNRPSVAAGASMGTASLTEEEYSTIVNIAMIILYSTGMRDTAILRGDSKGNTGTPFEVGDRGTKNMRDAARNPKSLTDLFHSMDDIMEIGQNDAGVVRVFHRENTNDFIVLFPETNASFSCSEREKNPNNWLTNMKAIQGDAAILHAYKDVVDNAIKDANIENSEDANIMLGGFSQGGLLSGLFAQRFQSDYNIEEVVSLGAPISGFLIPEKTNVLSLKYENDPIAFLDRGIAGEKFKRKSWETLYAKGGFHSTDLYIKGVNDGSFKIEQKHHFDRYLSGNLDMTDYYVTKNPDSPICKK
jgi:hypothetical protein